MVWMLRRPVARKASSSHRSWRPPGAGSTNPIGLRRPCCSQISWNSGGVACAHPFLSEEGAAETSVGAGGGDEGVAPGGGRPNDGWLPGSFFPSAAMVHIILPPSDALKPIRPKSLLAHSSVGHGSGRVAARGPGLSQVLAYAPSEGPCSKRSRKVPCEGSGETTHPPGMPSPQGAGVQPSRFPLGPAYEPHHGTNPLGGRYAVGPDPALYPPKLPTGVVSARTDHERDNGGHPCCG